MGPTLTLLPLLMGCILPDPHPATLSQTLLLQVGAVIVYIIFTALSETWCNAHLCGPDFQVAFTPAPLRLMRLLPTMLPLLTLLLWASSPHMTQTSPRQQQVSPLS